MYKIVKSRSIPQYKLLLLSFSFHTHTHMHTHTNTNTHKTQKEQAFVQSPSNFNYPVQTTCPLPFQILFLHKWDCACVIVNYFVCPLGVYFQGHLLESVGWNWQNANDKSTGAILIGTSKGELDWVKQPIACPQGQHTCVPQYKPSSVHAPCGWWHLQDGQLQQTFLKLRISRVIYLSRNDTTRGVECSSSVVVMAFSSCARFWENVQQFVSRLCFFLFFF